MSEQIITKSYKQRINSETIKQIHKMLDEKNTHAEIMRVLGVTKRQVTYQASFRQKRQTFTDIARHAGININTFNKRKQKGMTNEQIVNHEKWARYKQLAD